MLIVISKLLGFAVLTLLALPIGLLIKLCDRPRWILHFAQLYFKICAKIVGLRVHVKGQIQDQQALLLVSNHISYFDIMALGAAAPVTFIPKSEIARWPVIGTLSRIIGCVFIDRRRSQTKANMGAIHQGLKEGKPLVLFAEGTTGHGKTILPIRSSYFQLVEDLDIPLTIQPVKITYERIHGLPMDEMQRYRIAWVGNESLLPHLYHSLRLGTIDVSVHFLDKIDLSDCYNRKDIATKCQQIFARQA